ncbi:MAG TPA: DUF167 domain-containing protein [Syntrophales bacterium]|nr:DUF167 domain-containing protein [Syntrophales bacterium]
MIEMKEKAGGVQFAVRVIPGASKNEVAGIQEGALKIKLTAPPVEGKANKACVDFLARLLGMRRSALAIVSGGKSRKKTVTVDGIGRSELELRLKDILAP